MKRKRVSENGLDLIRRAEGLVLTAYQNEGDVPTIGYGHTRGVRLGDRIAKSMAEDYLRMDAHEAGEAVCRLVKREIRQCQFDALVDFVFNLGADQFSKSTLLRVINSGGSDKEVCGQLRRWVYCSGKKLPGLVTRRERECEMWLGHV